MLTRRRRRQILLLPCVGWLAAAAGTTQAATPQETYQSLFGAETKRVQATPDKKDDVAFGKKLLNAAASLADDPELQAVIYGQAYDFAAADPSGYDTAQKAMADLAAAQPKQRAACEERILSLLERQFRTGTAAARKSAGSAYVEKLTEFADARAAGGGLDESLALYRKGMAIATAQGAESRTAFTARIGALEERIATRNRITDLTNRLKANPSDRKTAVDLVTAMLLDADDPAQAAKHAAATGDAALQQIAALAIKAPAELTDAEALVLGDWYKAQARGSGRGAAFARAKASYERFLEAYKKEDAQRLKVKLALDEIAPLATVAGAGTTQKPAVPAGATTTAATRTINLLALIDPDKDALAGVWRRDKSELVLESGPRYSPLRIAYQPPEEFDFHVEFTRPEGKANIGLLWSRGDAPARWEIGSAPAPPLESRRRYNAVVRVRKGEVSTFLDGTLVARHKPDAAELVGDASSSIGRGALGVGAGSGPARFHVVELIEVTGKGRPAPRGGDLDAKDWRLLLRDDRTGRWADAPLGRITVTVKDGVLEARNSGTGRAVLYYARQRMDGIFSTTFAWSGGDEVTLRATDGADDAIVHTVADDKWHTARWRRSEREIGLFVDEQQAGIAARNNPAFGGPMFFCFELAPGHTLRLRHFALSTPTEAPKPG